MEKRQKTQNAHNIEGFFPSVWNTLAVVLPRCSVVTGTSANRNRIPGLVLVGTFPASGNPQSPSVQRSLAKSNLQRSKNGRDDRLFSAAISINGCCVWGSVVFTLVRRRNRDLCRPKLHPWPVFPNGKGFGALYSFMSTNPIDIFY